MSAPTQTPARGLEQEVLRRYARGAERVEPALCCPTDAYDPALLEVIPQEILEKDYGCGDPSRHAMKGEIVLDLGCGAGKICYILAQRVGAEGRVIGVDFNQPMLGVARRHQEAIGRRLGFNNTRFVQARIQDLALDLEAAAAWLRRHPVQSLEELDSFEAHCDMLRQETPLVADASVDLVVSNCVLNLVRPRDKQQLFAEIHRVLRPGGRAVISDITCDRDPTPAILADPELWSGCIAGAFREDRFPAMFTEAGFCCVQTLARQEKPWRMVDGVAFRAMTLRATKGEGTARQVPSEAGSASAPGSGCCG